MAKGRLLEWNKKAYLLIVDYCSRSIEVSKLNKTTAYEVINHSRIFTRQEIPEFKTMAHNVQLKSLLSLLEHISSSI